MVRELAGDTTGAVTEIPRECQSARVQGVAGRYAAAKIDDDSFCRRVRAAGVDARGKSSRWARTGRPVVVAASGSEEQQGQGKPPAAWAHGQNAAHHPS